MLLNSFENQKVNNKIYKVVISVNSLYLVSTQLVFIMVYNKYIECVIH